MTRRNPLRALGGWGGLFRRPPSPNGPRSANGHGHTPPPADVEATERLVDVIGFVGPALVLRNGTFIRMLEVAPIDLERGDATLRQKYWGLFADALRRLRAPIGVQLVVSCRPQNIGPYLERWEQAAHEWTRRANASTEPADRDRRERMAESAVETAAFLVAAHERLMPIQQRYLVVVHHNPFPEAQSDKPQRLAVGQAVRQAALEKLEEHLATVRAAIGEIGLPVYELDPPAMCQAVWEHYHHPAGVMGGSVSPLAMLEAGLPEATATRAGSRDAVSPLAQCPGPEAFMAARRDPARLAELLAPTLVEETEKYIRVGETVGRGYEMHDFDPRTPVDFGALLTFNGDVTHALFLWPTDPVAIRLKIKERETDLKSADLVDARRGALANHGRAADIQSIEEARARIEIAMQAPFDLLWFAMVWANDLETLEKQCQQFETQLHLRDIRFRRATRQQLPVLQSTRPLARSVMRVTPRNMSAESLGPFFPFVRREYFDPEGWHFGVHRGNGLIVCLNPFEDGKSNASELVLGAPGGGKSVYLKQTIETLLALGHRVFVVDPEREYLQLAVDHHAPYIEMGKRRDSPPVPIDPRREDAWVQGLVEVGDMIESLTGDTMTRDQVYALNRVYREAMAGAGLRDEDPATWRLPAPSLTELGARLAAQPERSVRELGRVLGYVNALAGGNTINIMEMNLDSETPWASAAESLAAFVEAILGRPLATRQFNALIGGYQATMEKWGFRAEDPATWTKRAPTLSALAATLGAERAPESHELAEVLEQYAHGLYADLFNRPTTVDPSGAQFVVFGLRSLREKVERSLAPVFAWQVLRFVWNTVVASGAVQPIHLFIDEAWYVLQQPGAAARLEAMARSFRKYNAALHVATQAAEEMMNSPQARVIAEIGRVKTLFAQESEAASRAIGTVLGLSEGEQASLMRAGKGEALLLLGNHVRLPVYVAVNPLHMNRLSTNRDQQRAVARASGRKASPVL